MRNYAGLIASSLCLAMVAVGAVADENETESRGTTGTAQETPTPPSTPAPSTKTPPPAAPGQFLSAAGEGRRAWLKYNCSGCHGDRAGGGMGPNIAGAESGDISEAVNSGEGGGMPSYRNIVNATDVTNLGAYLRSIGTTSEPKFNDWWVPIPPK